VPAADMLAVSFQTLLLKPACNLKVADHQSTGTLADGNGIADVVTVAMADQDEIGLRFIGSHGSGRVAREEWVDQDFMPSGFEAEGSMAEPGKFK
jgi:hypothetical protein